MEKLYTEQLYLSKKERLGIIILCVILFASTVVPYIFNKSKIIVQGSSDQPNTTKRENSEYEYDDLNEKKFQEYESKKLPLPVKIQYSDFDPNTLQAEHATQLGIPKKTFTILEKFRSKGFKFRRAEDFKKVYGLSESLYNKLFPYIKIPEIKKDSLQNKPKSKNSIAAKEMMLLEINKATEEEWKTIDGIGEKLTDRIIKFRNSLGGFHSIDQISEVYGIVDSTFRKIKPFLNCEASIVKLAINSSDFDELNLHPYIDYKQAQFIVNYRRQHGRINSIEDLISTNYFSEEWIKKVEIYLSFE